VAVAFVRADGERLPFADASFDRVWGNAVLHHLEPRRRRASCTASSTVAASPSSANRGAAIPCSLSPAGALPYPGKERTPDEQPLRRRQVEVLRAIFPDMEVEGFQLVSMLRRVLGPGRVARALERSDGVLLRHAPILGHFCRM